MKVCLLSTLALVALLFVSACQNQYRQLTTPSTGRPSGVVDVSGGAYQVTAQEYDQFFETRYGLLFQKFSDSPFTGRVLTIDKGVSGEFVASDESWSKGRKHGVSSRWFSNGVKMYERNYDEGKWHGTVTRWWPNGQKMYVRAYNDGVKHGKDATWRSDGDPIDSPSRADAVASEPSSVGGSDESTKRIDETPSVTPVEEFSPPAVTELPSFPPTEPSSPGVLPPLPGEPDPGLPPLPAPSGGDELPSFPPVESTGGDLPPLPGEPDLGLPPLPAPSGGDELPSFPPVESTGGDLPPLPGATPSSEALPALPGESTDELPPFPGAETSPDELPPLPPLP